jgi:hypothetical protein
MVGHVEVRWLDNFGAQVIEAAQLVSVSYLSESCDEYLKYNDKDHLHGRDDVCMMNDS